MSDTYPLSLLQAVSDWQRSYTVRRAKTLKAQCAALSEEFRTCPLVCYRQIALPKGGVWSLLGENKLSEKISSWTLEIDIAKGFKGGVPPQGQGYQGTILCMYPPPGSVIVNLWKLYENSAFKTALEASKGEIDGYYDGAGRFVNTQSEVVLEIESVTPEDVFSLGEYSSPLETLVHQAAELVYRRPSTPAERQALLLQAKRAGIEAGPDWLNMDATRRVLARTKPQAALLAEVKRLQQAR